MELIQNSVAEGVDLVELNGLIHRQVAGDLREVLLPLALPALCRLLRGEQPGQVRLCEKTGRRGKHKAGA